MVVSKLLPQCLGHNGVCQVLHLCFLKAYYGAAMFSHHDSDYLSAGWIVETTYIPVKYDTVDQYPLKHDIHQICTLDCFHSGCIPSMSMIVVQGQTTSCDTVTPSAFLLQYHPTDRLTLFCK
jgi:hypothetical protein